MPGVFDKEPRNKETITDPPKQEIGKIDFGGTQEMFNKQGMEKAQKTAAMKQKTSAEAQVEKINEIMSGAQGKKQEADEFSKMEKIKDEDLKLAEELIFRGYAEKTYVIPHFKGHTFTFVSTNGDEMALIEEMLFDIIKAHDEGGGIINYPEINMRTMRNLFALSLSYKGQDGKDFMEHDAGCQLHVIKRATSKLSDYELSGNMKEGNELRDSIKDAIKKRALTLRKRPPAVIDMLNNSKYDFDQLMFSVMQSEGLYPKS